MCKEIPAIPVNRVVDPKRIIGKNGGPRRRRGTRGPGTPLTRSLRVELMADGFLTWFPRLGRFVNGKNLHLAQTS
jgi:hypothetical protein